MLIFYSAGQGLKWMDLIRSLTIDVQKTVSTVPMPYTSSKRMVHSALLCFQIVSTTNPTHSNFLPLYYPCILLYYSSPKMNVFGLPAYMWVKYITLAYCNRQYDWLWQDRITKTEKQQWWQKRRWSLKVIFSSHLNPLTSEVIGAP